MFGLEAEEISLLRALQYARAAGGRVMPLVDTAGGAQDARVVGGIQQVSERLPAELGDRVRLGRAGGRARRGGGRTRPRRPDGRVAWAAQVLGA